MMPQAGGFRDAARLGGISASSLSEAVRRLEAKLGVRLQNRTTRSIAPTEADARLICEYLAILCHDRARSSSQSTSASGDCDGP
jgi:DNA-binding transcriptional LysR family regulator